MFNIMYVPFPAVSACSKSQFNKYPTKRLIPAQPTVSPPTPSHQRSVSLHGTPQRNSIRENFNSAMIDFTRFSKNNFPKKFFRNFHKKSFRHTQQTPGSRFSKNTASHLSPGPASTPNLMQPTQKNRKLCRSLIKKLCELCGIFYRKNF